MARISVLFVRASLLHFAVGATVGAWGLAAKSGFWPPFPWSIRSLHVEVMLIGWVCQLAVGVALWILPFSGGVSEDRRFWAAWLLLNGAIALVVLGRGGAVLVLWFAGRACELCAGGLLGWGLWPRLRPFPGHESG
jgi:hypothetical protein